MAEPTIIIQARMGSSRFPGKVAADLCGQSVLERVVRRCWEIQSTRRVGIAAPYHEKIEEIAKALDVPVFWAKETDAGPLGNDVLKRYMDAAIHFNADPIIRITADCPMLRPDLCDKVIELFGKDQCAYAAIGEGMTYPKGYGCEVFSFFALQIANMFALTAHDRQHVTPWMERNLKSQYLTQDKDESHINYCVDTPEDLARLKGILAKNKP